MGGEPEVANGGVPRSRENAEGREVELVDGAEDDVEDEN